MQRKAFTLVELLVVIGIIALLISILLPALSKARQNALRVKCAAQLRQVGVATVIYANENKGALPPTHLEGNREGSTWDLQNNLQYIWVNNWRAGAFDPVKDAGANIGRLMKTKALSGNDPNWIDNPITFCPGRQAGATDYLQRYYFNIHPKIVTTPAPTGPGTTPMPTPRYERWWTRLSNYGKVPSGPVNTQFFSSTDQYQWARMPYALACDPIYDLSTATHAQGRGRAWNLLYSDGSVRTAVCDQRTARDPGKWQRFLDMLGYLERLADGQPVETPPKWNGIYNGIPIDPPTN